MEDGKFTSWMISDCTRGASAGSYKRVLYVVCCTIWINSNLVNLIHLLLNVHFVRKIVLYGKSLL
jgi:hypothetical protein